ncbi:YhdP family protein [Polynucleobacter necessarius]|uniref:YhdP family protein n=1 Tax=Polynucleobacter necessarius TaxID=576610 RepID=UPI000FE1D5BA|nr:YhdP family protein [Polynucleobacter necessarius]
MLQKIIPPRLKSVFAKRPQGSGGPWRKRALVLAVFTAALLVLGHLTVRFVIWPQVEKSKASIEKLTGARIGVNVSIDNLRVSWTGIRPDFEIEGLRFNGKGKADPTLQVQKISGELSWNSFYHLAPHFHELYLEGAQIYAQRNQKGIISIAGITTDSNSNNYSFENWLFSQNNIDIKNVKIIWDDQLNKKSISDINIQTLSLSNGIRRHIGKLQTTTPWTSGPLNLEVNFIPYLGGQAGDWHDWIGTVSWNLTDLNLDRLAKEFALPLNALEGKLSTNGKIKIDNGKPDGGEAFIAADNLIIQLSKGEDAIALGRLETSLSQEADGGLISVTTKNFAWRDIDSPKTAPLESLSPMTFRWRPPAADGEIKEFGFSSPKISVDDIALFALNLPLSKKVHGWIKASKAEGELQNLDISWSESKSPLSALNIPGGWFKSNKIDFSISAKLIDLSFVGINKSMPTVSNLSGFLTANQNQGSFSVNSNNLDLEVNGLLADPKIQLDQANGQINWSKSKGNWVISTKKLSLSNPEITTNLSINYIIGGPKDPDSMNLDMDFSNAKLVSAYRYLPVSMDKDTQTYLSKAFAGGVIQNGSLHIKGDPNAIPFPKGVDGEFSLKLPIVGATFSPAPSSPGSQVAWPAFTNVNGVIAMQNSNFTVDISKANYKQVALNQFHAEIPNVSAKQLVLSVNGNAQGEAPQMLDYLLSSPVGKKQVKLEKNLQISGPANLVLGLKVPLSGSGNTNTDIQLDFPGNKVQRSDLPPFENLKGKIRITEVNPEFEDVTANFLGGSIKITSNPTSQGNQSFSISGDIAANFIRNYFSNNASQQSIALLQAMNGSSKYEGTIYFNKGGSETLLKIDLRDWASSAPAPLKKAAGSPMLGQITVRTSTSSDLSTGAGRISWNGKIGDQYFVQGELGKDDEIRQAIGIGAPANLPQQGIQLYIASSELNLDAWQDFLGNQNKNIAAPKSGKLNSGNIQISGQVKKLGLFDRTWPDFTLSASNKNNAWQIKMSSPAIAGNLQYQEPSNADSSGLISGRLAHLKIPDAIASPINTKKPSPKKTSGSGKVEPGSIPSLDISIDDFLWGKAQLGQIKLKSKTSGNLLKIESLQISNPQGSSVFSGQWRGATQTDAEQTELNANLDVKDAGQIIAHWSSQKSVEGGQGQVGVNAQWEGSPFAPKYETLSGKANLNLTKGRLLEVNSSGAKLLDVLSLQSLFRFATLDLKGSLGNIVTKGTPFNSIDANFDISAGLAQTKQFNVVLDQARVAMTGQINIPKQTQDLRVTIFPTIDATAGSLAAFAINPIVGLGALVGQYLITNQINRNLQSDYLVQGSWENPEVIPLDQKGQPIDSKTLENIRSKDLLKEQVKPGSNPPPTPAQNRPANPG